MTTDPRKISNSELRLWKRCRRKWWLSQYRGLRPKTRDAAGARALGHKVHVALAEYYDPDGGLDSEATLKLWDSMTAEDVEKFPDQEKDIRKDHDLGRAMLEGYFEWLATEGADADWEVIAAEHEAAVPLENYDGPRPVVLLAKLDVRVRSQSRGMQFFVDHKTVGNLTDLPKTADLSEQFLHYGLIDYLEHRADPDAVSFVDGGIFNMLRKVKRTARANPPFFGRHEVRHTVDEYRSYWFRLVGEISDIQRAEDRLEAGEDHRTVVYPNPTRDCSWDCDFRAVCPMLDDPKSDPEGFLAEAYVVGDPYDRYDLTTEDA